MADNSGSRDRAFEALDFIINVLKEHEQTLDKSIHELATVVEQRAGSSVSDAKVEKIEQKIDGLQKELAKIAGSLSNPSRVQSAPVSHQDSPVNAAQVVSPPIVQGMPSMVLNCKQWGDFRILAMHPQILSFSIRENEKIFQVEAVKGSQIYTYTGELPTWLDNHDLKINE